MKFTVAASLALIASASAFAPAQVNSVSSQIGLMIISVKNKSYILRSLSLPVISAQANFK
jgi:hypothetical protein